MLFQTIFAYNWQKLNRKLKIDSLRIRDVFPILRAHTLHHLWDMHMRPVFISRVNYCRKQIHFTCSRSLDLPLVLKRFTWVLRFTFGCTLFDCTIVENHCGKVAKIERKGWWGRRAENFGGQNTVKHDGNDLPMASCCLITRL